MRRMNPGCKFGLIVLLGRGYLFECLHNNFSVLLIFDLRDGSAGICLTSITLAGSATIILAAFV